MPVLRFDFHLHTLDDPVDHHVFHTVFELIDKAAGLGYGALAITLHNTQFESSRASEYAAERGIMLLPGTERDIEGCHVLLINYPRQVTEAIHTFDDLRKARSNERLARDGLAIAAHPFFPGGVSLK